MGCFPVLGAYYCTGNPGGHVSAHVSLGIVSKLRETPENQLEVNIIQEAIEEPIDMIKLKVDKLIEKFKSDKENEDYRKMSELKDTEGPKRKSAPAQEYPDIE